MVFWWCVAGVVLAVVYMVTYVVLRTSGDGRRWTTRLAHHRSGSGRGGRTSRPH